MKEVEKTPIELDLEYLKISLEDVNTQLKQLRYNIKEIKACINTATEENNTQRIPVLRQQKTKTNDLMKAAMIDVKRISSIYKFYLRGLKRNE